MGLSQALSTAMSGLRTNQAALALVSSNVSNAETPGYIRKTAIQNQTVAGVQVTGINRVLDQYIQTQLLTETSGASYASVRANTLSNLQSIYGDPASANTLESAFNTLTAALQGLATSPESPSSRTAVINAAQAMAQQLNQTSQGIQGLRTSAETGIATAVSTANNALAQIARINGQLQSLKPSDGSAAALMDQRDQYVSQLSQLMDVRVSTEGSQISVFTGSGFQLVTGVTAGTLSFNPQGAVTPNAQWNADPAKSGLSSVMLDLPNGGTIDLTAANAIRSGSIAAYLELRDRSLVQAQAQVDQLAAAMASALSDKTTSTPVTSGTQNGFSFDLSAPQNGNIIRIGYTDTSGKAHNVSVVLVNDPSVLPLKNTDIANSNDEVIGVDFSGGMTSVISQLNAALASSNLQFSASGDTLTVLGGSGGGLPTVQSGTLTQTAGSLTSGEAQLPFFLDGNSLYTGAITAAGLQQTGLAARITINPSLQADSSRLIGYGASTPAGDTTRVDFISTRLKSGTYTYSSATGVGSASSPFKGTLLNYTQQFLGMQANAASSAQALSDGQDVVLATLQKKMDSVSGVDIDEEMANLLALQNAYAANARVMSTVNSMFQALMQVL